MSRGIRPTFAAAGCLQLVIVAVDAPRQIRRLDTGEMITIPEPIPDLTAGPAPHLAVQPLLILIRRPQHPLEQLARWIGQTS